MLSRLFRSPLKAKGRVLRGARLRLHGLAPCAPPEGVPTGASALYFCLDVTISPRADGERNLPWEPGRLEVIEPGKPHAHACWVARIEIARNGRVEQEPGEPHEGPARLRFVVGVAPGVEQIQLRYYLERCVAFDLPLGPEPAAEPASAPVCSELEPVG